MEVRNLDRIFEADIPEDKLLQKEETTFIQNETEVKSTNGYLEIDNDDLPF